MSHLGELNEPSTCPSMLRKAQAGDMDAWQRLAQVYGPIVYAWARRCGCQSADAADIMQDTFASVAGALSGFDYQRPDATFRGWLWTITRNKIRDSRRNKDENAVGGTAAQLSLQQVAAADAKWIDGDDPPSEIESDQKSVRGRMLELIRESFDPRSWKMFWETAVVGREPQAVADEMGVSRWAVYKARARVLQRLQQQMEGLE